MGGEFKREPAWDDDDSDKPAPSREITLEQECALITPEALLSLQADLLGDPGGSAFPSQAPPIEDAPSPRRGKTMQRHGCVTHCRFAVTRSGGG